MLPFHSAKSTLLRLLEIRFNFPLCNAIPVTRLYKSLSYTDVILAVQAVFASGNISFPNSAFTKVDFPALIVAIIEILNTGSGS